MKYSSIKPAIIFFKSVRMIFSPPSKTTLLVFDRVGSEDLIPYFRDIRYAILDVRGESINIYILLITIIKHLNKTTFEKYVDAYIKYVKPICVITFIDNSEYFYKLKSKNPNVNFISIQNGWRDNILFDIFKKNLDQNIQLKSDYLFCFGEAVGTQYNKFIKTKVIPIGSFKNNKIPISRSKYLTKSSVLFISQYRIPVDSEIGYSMPLGDKHVPWEKFYSAEYKILPFLSNFCIENNLLLKICGGSESENEKHFFNNIINNDKWEYVERKDTYSSYYEIDNANLVVFVDSTLGYEAMSRGIKVAAFSIRGKDIENNDHDFGYHAKLPQKGPFWTNEFNIGEMKKILEFLLKIKDEEWNQISNPYLNKLMSYDNDNSIFLNIINKITNNHV